MQKSYDEDKSQEEQSKNLEEGLKEDKEKKDKELLDALKEAKDKKDNPTAKEEKEEEESFMDKLADALGLEGGFSALRVLGNVAKFFLTSPLGLGLLAGASLLALLARDKHAEETNKGIQNAGKADGGLGEAITEAADDEVASKKATLLRKAHKEGAIKSSWYEFGKQGKEEEDYLKSVGFDAKTGTTSKERESSSTPAPSATGPSTPPPPPPAPTPTAEAAPNVGSNISQKLNAATKENVFGKLDEKINSVAGAVVNNTSASSASKQQSPTGKLPAVRNQEDTFMRMIYNNTRVV